MTTFNFSQSRCLTLDNGLTVMLCPPPGHEQSGFVSMAVKAGHFYDPKPFPGLAHLLEHGLFLGSQRLPEANAINDIVERCGGAINAWTGTEYANYHFHCQDDTLPQLLPAFADMLSQPLLSPCALTKEIEAIDAEFQFKRKDDLRRLYQIHKETCNPAHPFSQFSVGNAEIFNACSIDELQAALLAHHARYYCASNMALCIVSSQPLDELEAHVRNIFSALPAGERAPDDWPALYLPEQLGVQINIEPLQTARRMIVTFPLPALHNDYKVKPLNFISHLLGDEGEGSLLAYLKQQNWCTNLIAGSGIESDDFKDFNVSFQLTETGLAHQADILEALFAYLALIRDGLDDPWRYAEKMQLHALACQYDDAPKLMPLACDYAQHLFIFDFDEIPHLREPVEDYNKDRLHEVLDYFAADAIRIKLIAPGVSTNQTCAYYDAHYAVEPLDEALLQRLRAPASHPALALPPPNPYLGSEYTLAPIEQEFSKPQMILQERGLRCWFGQDTQFDSPKGDIYLSFDTPAFCADVNAIASKRIWLACLNDELQSKYYRAEIAGLHYRLYGHQAGFSLHTRGFTHQQDYLVQELVDALTRIQPEREQFALRQAMQIQNLQNSLLNKPTNRLFSRLSVLIQRNTQAPIDLLKAVTQCRFEDMQHTAAQALDHFYLESFMHGNWSSDQAHQFSQTLRERFGQANGEPLPRSVSRLPTGETYFHQVPSEQDDAAVIVYLQAPSASIEDTVLCMVLEQLLSGPFFTILRTQKQLGYVVGTGYVPHNQHPGIALYIQSPRYAPARLYSEIRRFLADQLKQIELFAPYWQNIQHNLLKQLEERDLSLSMKSQRLWISLGTADYQFNRNQRLAQCVQGMQFDKVKSYAAKVAAQQIFGELMLYAQGKFEHEVLSGGVQQDDISAFKAMMTG